MNILYLICQRIKQYYLKNKLIFLLFMIGGVINAVVLVYSYGNLLPAVRNRESDNVTYRKYTVSFQEHKAINLKDVDSLRQDPLLESVMAGCRIPPKHLGASNGVYYLFAYDPAYPTPVASGTNQFTDGNQILAPINCMKQIGDQVTLYGKSFTIIGKLQVLDEYYIPWDTFLGLLQAKDIVLIQAVSKDRHDCENDPVIQLLKSKFPDSKKVYGSNESLTKSERARTASEYPDIIAVYLISTLAYMFLLWYLVDSIMDENIISAFVGASRSTITVMVFWETMILSLVSNGIGFLVHVLLYQPLFSKINISDGMVYYAGDYLMLMLLVFVISMLISIPFVVKYMRMSPVSAKREHV